MEWSTHNYSDFGVNAACALTILAHLFVPIWRFIVDRSAGFSMPILGS